MNGLFVKEIRHRSRGDLGLSLSRADWRGAVF